MLSAIQDTYELQKLDRVATFNQIKLLPQIGAVKNNWRRRWVSLHEHPGHPSKLVFSIGMPFDNPTPSNAVLCIEPKEGYEWILESWPKAVTQD